MGVIKYVRAGMEYMEQSVFSRFFTLLLFLFSGYAIASEPDCSDVRHIVIGDQQDETLTSVVMGELDGSSCGRSTAITGAVTITQSGSYYLDNDVSGKITVSASRVVLDLNGYTIASTSDSGIEISSTSCVVIRNGFVASGSYYSDHGCIKCNASSKVICSGLICIPSLSANGFVVSDSSEIILSGCKVSAQGPSNISGVSLEKAHKVTIEHCDIHGFYNGVYFSPVATSSHVIIQHCLISDSGFYAVQMRASTGNVVRHNIIRNNAKGIWIVSGSTKTLVFGNLVKDCTGTTSSEPAIYDLGTLSKIYGNVAQDNMGGHNYSAAVPLQAATLSFDTGVYTNINW